MINLKILVPDDTINYIKNPAFRYATTGWNAVGSTLTRTLDYARFNIASGKVVTNGSAANEGVYYRVLDLSGVSEPVTISAYIRGQGKVRIRLIDNPTGKQYVSSDVSLTLDRWQRIEVSGFSTGSNDMRLYVETSGAAKAITFYVDGAQMERKPYATTYCDGDQDGCRWNVVSHGSVSSRTKDTRAGGRWVPLAGPCRHNNDLYVTVLGGFGMPPIINQIQPWANAPGSFFQNEKVHNRVVTLNFHTKNKQIIPGRNTSMRYLSELRQQLIDLLKSDKTLNSEAFLFSYEDTDGDKTLYIRMRYEAGLEGEWDIRNKWYNSFPVRMLAVDPFFEQDTQDVKSLAIKKTVTSATAINSWAKIGNVWDKVSASIALSGDVNCLAEAKDGTVYAGGNFTNNGLNRIAKWDGTSWTPLGSGLNNIVHDISISPEGYVYVVGSFTTAGGIGAGRFARWDPTLGTWGNFGDLSATGYAVLAAKNGSIYVGGDFLSVSGVVSNFVARYDGSSWKTVGSMSGLNNTVRTLIENLDGTYIYAGGDFTDARGAALNTYMHVVAIDTTTNLFSTMGGGVSGASASVYKLCVGLDGTVYAGGTFTLNSAGDSTLRIAEWRGGELWNQLGAGVDNLVREITCDKNGVVYLAGSFRNSGSKRLSNIAKYVGTIISPVEIDISPTSGGYITAVLQHTNGDLYIGSSSITPFVSYMPDVTTVTNNGSASCWPIMRIGGQGTLRYIANNKTGQEIFLDLKVFVNEDVFIDFARGKITSSARGDLSYTIMQGSEIRSIYLLPGDNSVSVLIVDDVTAAASLQWKLLDWSADAIVDAEEL